MVLDPERFETQQTYGYVLSFLLRTYAADDTTTEAYNDVANLQQNFALT